MGEICILVFKDNWLENELLKYNFWKLTQGNWHEFYTEKKVCNKSSNKASSFEIIPQQN